MVGRPGCYDIATYTDYGVNLDDLTEDINIPFCTVAQQQAWLITGFYSFQLKGEFHTK